MTTLAAMPGWMVLVIILAAMGPMMRMLFGGRRFPPAGRHRLRWKDADEVARLDAAIAERDSVLEDLQRRLSEMESRLDFTERLLAEHREPADLPVR